MFFFTCGIIIGAEQCGSRVSSDVVGLVLLAVGYWEHLFYFYFCGIYKYVVSNPRRKTPPTLVAFVSEYRGTGEKYPIIYYLYFQKSYQALEKCDKLFSKTWLAKFSAYNVIRRVIFMIYCYLQSKSKQNVCFSSLKRSLAFLDSILNMLLCIIRVIVRAFLYGNMYAKLKSTDLGV